MGRYGEEDVGYDGGDWGDEGRWGYDVDVGGGRYGDEGEYEEGKVCEDNVFGGVEVGEWEDEEERDRIGELGYDGKE